jgi:hypothetical protein
LREPRSWKSMGSERQGVGEEVSLAKEVFICTKTV